MKKVLAIVIGAGAVTAAFFLIRKYSKAQEPVKPKNIPRQHQHHLTNAFANAKKHAVK